MMKFLFLASLLFSEFAFSNVGGFETFSADYKPLADSTIPIKNEPPVRSQDSVGLCYGFTAAGAFDFAYCQHKESEFDCAHLPEENSASSISMSSYSSDEGLKSDIQGIKATGSKGNQAISEGGSASEAVENALYNVRNITKESCAPFDKIVSKNGTKTEIETLQTASWQNLLLTYKLFRKKFNGCSECAMKEQMFSTAIDKIKIDFKLNRSNEKILAAFGAETYSAFLGQLLIPGKCTVPEQKIFLDSTRWSVKIGEKDFTNYESSIEKLKAILTKGNPLIVDGYCTMENKPKSAAGCKGNQHSFLISGYRKVCKGENDCRDVVKVHNSWGQSWQDQNDGGWVSAKEVFDRTFYQAGAFHWLEEK